MTRRSPRGLASSPACARAALAQSDPSYPTTMSLIDLSSIRHYGRFATDLALEDPGVRRLPLALEELRVDDVRDHHEHDAKQDQPDADCDRGAHSEEATRVGRGRVLVVDVRLDEDPGQHQSAGERHHTRHEEVLCALQQLLAEIDHAGEAG